MVTKKHYLNKQNNKDCDKTFEVLYAPVTRRKNVKN